MKAKVLDSTGNVLRTAPMAMILLVCSITASAGQNEEKSISTNDARARSTDSVRGLAAVAEMRSITRELLTLAKSGASPERIAEWQENNAARLTASQQKLAEMSARQNAVPKSYLTEVPIPAGASKTMEEFQLERAIMYNQQARIHNQTLRESPEKRNEAVEVWQKQNAAELEAQASRASQIIIEMQSAAKPSPSSVAIPPDAAPALRKFLTQRTALVREEAKVAAGLKTLSPEQRQKALEAWREANPTVVRAIQETAKQLSIESKTSR